MAELTLMPLAPLLKRIARAALRPDRLFIAASVLTVLTIVWFFIPPSDIEALKSGALRDWSKLRQERKELGYKPTQAYRSFDRIDPDFAYAVVCGEDAGFFFHNGFELGEIWAATRDWLSGDDEQLRGASTLTQQLAKNLFLSEDRSFIRKLQEARYAFWLEQKLSKRRILELYLNMVELGTGVFGAEAGAQRYFGASAAALGPDAAAALAATIPSPKKHNPSTVTRSFLARKRAITERMHRFGNLRKYFARSDNEG